jgi:hypothetical protein
MRIRTTLDNFHLLYNLLDYKTIASIPKVSGKLISGGAVLINGVPLGAAVLTNRIGDTKLVFKDGQLR